MNAPEQIPAEQSTAMIVPERRGGMVDLSPQNFEQALTFANYLADSEMVPKDFRGKPGNCLIAMQWGAEVGLKPLQALQNIAVINGRPSLWGDSVIALVRASPLCEYVVEEDDGQVATCRTKRRGAPGEQVERFGMEDAKAAGLLGKQGPWTQYPKRMRKMRARAFLLRDVYADVLRGLHQRLLQGHDIDSGAVESLIAMSAEPTLDGIVSKELENPSVMIRTRKKTIVPRSTTQIEYMLALASRGSAYVACGRFERLANRRTAGLEHLG